MSDPQNTTTSAAPAPQPGTPEHDAAMVALYDKAHGNAAPDADKKVDETKQETLILGKFKTADDLAKAYTELEKKLGSTDNKKVDAKPDGDNKKVDTKTDGDKKADPLAIPKEGDEKAAKDAVESAGLNFDELSTEYKEKGGLTDESYAKLEKAGIPRHVVDAYIDGQEARESQIRNDILSEAGGEESYKQIVQWAAKSLTKGEIAAYDAAVTAGSPEQAKLAVAGLVARFEKSNGRLPNLVQGGSPNLGGDKFSSSKEMADAINDPRFAVDPAYRAEVERKIGNSDVVSARDTTDPTYQRAY